MDNKLFKKEDVLTCIDAEQAVLGMPGYFGNTVSDLVLAISKHDVRELASIDQEEAYCFKNNSDKHYILFLPLGRVKKTYTYRPLANLAELLVFLVPDLDANAVCDSAGNDDEIIRYKKAELLLGKKITIREKHTEYTNVLIISRVDFYGDSDTGDDIYINGSSLNYLFENYKILIDGKWQPFGVKEWNWNNTQ